MQNRECMLKIINKIYRIPQKLRNLCAAAILILPQSSNMKNNDEILTLYKHQKKNKYESILQFIQIFIIYKTMFNEINNLTSTL